MRGGRGGGNERKESLRLRSLLGTAELFDRVLARHRAQFLARIGVVTECLRLEQERSDGGHEGDEDDGDGDSGGGRRGVGGAVGRSCARFLDSIDSELLASDNDRDGRRATATRKRGLFRLLLRLSCGPDLPGMGAPRCPQSVDDLRGASGVHAASAEVLSAHFNLIISGCYRLNETELH